MSSIRSTIGESNFAGTGQRRFVVPSGEAEPDKLPQVTPEMATTLRRQAHEHQEQASQHSLVDARRRIDIIIGIGRRTKEVPVETDNGTVIFTLRTLKTFEQNCLAQVVEQSERLTTADGRLIFAPTSLAKIRVEALSHSLFLIDGQSIDIILGMANVVYEDQVLARKDLINEMDHALINHLFNNYEVLAQETYDGYMPKTVEEAKEVAETISKSSPDA